MISHSQWVLTTDTVCGICLVALSCSVWRQASQHMVRAHAMWFAGTVLNAVQKNQIKLWFYQALLFFFFLLGFQWKAKLFTWSFSIWERPTWYDYNKKKILPDTSCLKPVECVWHDSTKMWTFICWNAICWTISCFDIQNAASITNCISNELFVCPELVW